MQKIKKRFRYHLLFWKSTWTICVSITIGLVLMALPNIPLRVVSLVSHFFLLAPVGVGLAVLYKELSHKEEYYFYHNQGITRIELWVSNCGVFFLLFLLMKVTEWLWRIS